MSIIYDETLNEILDEFYKNSKKILDTVDKNNMIEIASTLLKARKIFILGIGHSGMFGKILSMKLNHVGLRAFTVFDEINPPFTPEDIFIAISQSGETSTIISLAEKAKKIGGKIIGITSNRESSLIKLADNSLIIEKIAKNTSLEALGTLGDAQNQNLLGALFGFNLYVIFYTLVIMIAQKRGETPESINRRHANLQ